MAIERYNPADTQGMQRVADVGPLPDDPASNYAYAFTHAGPGGRVDTITATKDGVSWLLTLTFTGSDLTSIAPWVRL